jgi:hypothetical protein
MQSLSSQYPMNCHFHFFSHSNSILLYSILFYSILFFLSHPPPWWYFRVFLFTICKSKEKNVPCTNSEICRIKKTLAYFIISHHSSSSSSSSSSSFGFRSLERHNIMRSFRDKFSKIYKSLTPTRIFMIVTGLVALYIFMQNYSSSKSWYVRDFMTNAPQAAPTTTKGVPPSQSCGSSTAAPVIPASSSSSPSPSQPITSPADLLPSSGGGVGGSSLFGGGSTFVAPVKEGYVDMLPPPESTSLGKINNLDLRAPICNPKGGNTGIWNKREMMTVGKFVEKKTKQKIRSQPTSQLASQLASQPVNQPVKRTQPQPHIHI